MSFLTKLGVSCSTAAASGSARPVSGEERRLLRVPVVRLHPLAVAMLAASAATLPSIASAKPTLLAALTSEMQQSADAWNGDDLSGFMAIYERSPETTFVTKIGPVKGYKAVEDLYRKAYGGPAGLGKLTYSDLSATALGAGYAVLYGRFHLMSPGSSQEATGVFDLVMHKTALGWRILSDHTS